MPLAPKGKAWSSPRTPKSCQSPPEPCRRTGPSSGGDEPVLWRGQTRPPAGLAARTIRRAMQGCRLRRRVCFQAGGLKELAVVKPASGGRKPPEHGFTSGAPRMGALGIRDISGAPSGANAREFNCVGCDPGGDCRGVACRQRVRSGGMLPNQSHRFLNLPATPPARARGVPAGGSPARGGRWRRPSCRWSPSRGHASRSSPRKRAGSYSQRIPDARPGHRRDRDG